MVFGVAGSNPNPKQQHNEKVKLMIDGGLQSTACGVNFAKDYEMDDSERAKLWDIQDIANEDKPTRLARMSPETLPQREDC